MTESLTATIKTLSTIAVSDERKGILQPLVEYIQKKVIDNKTIRLNLICTHNSRRSHLSQVWSQTLAYHFGIKNLYSYSGGTEATALFPTILETLSNQGFQIDRLSEGANPLYSIKYAENENSIIGFSKKMDNPFNPQSEFAAIMTCSQADEGCPFVPGAEKRIPITYDDPKAFDNTALQAEKYTERSLQIATEMNYVFSQIHLK